MTASEAPDAEYRRFLAGGRLMIQRSSSSGQAVFPPRLMTPGSGDVDLVWTDASGKGVIHSFTVVSQKNPADSYNICLIDLEEGPRLMSRLIDGDPSIGQTVMAHIDLTGAEPVLVFRPILEPAG